MQVHQMFESKLIIKLYKANTFFQQRNKERTNKQTKKPFLFAFWCNLWILTESDVL